MKISTTVETDEWFELTFKTLAYNDQRDSDSGDRILKFLNEYDMLTKISELKLDSKNSCFVAKKCKEVK